MQLKLPNKYINIESDEMIYIDGGFDIISVRFAGAIINTALCAAVGAIGISGFIVAYGKTQAKRIFTRTIASKLAAWGCPKLAVALSGAIATALNYLDVGTNIAKYIDKYDYKPNNGWLSI